MKKSISAKSCKWIILVHQISPKLIGIRVKIWRKLKNIGAVSIKNSVYILPLTKEAYEHFQWLRQEIIALKGDATIFKVDSIEGIDDQSIINQFQRVRDKGYIDLRSKALKLKEKIEQNIKKKRVLPTKVENYDGELKKLKSRLNNIVRLDYFNSTGRKDAEKSVDECSNEIEKLKELQEKVQSIEKVPEIKIYNKKEFQNKIWITRKGIHIDRMASGWLIKRFIDKGASFDFIQEDSIVKNGIGYDVYNSEFTQRGEDCTFETLLKSFRINDVALFQIAEIVHDIDLKDDKFDRKEVEGIDQIIIGLSQRLKNDKKLLERGMEIFDALYQYYSSKIKEKGES